VRAWSAEGRPASLEGRTTRLQPIKAEGYLLMRYAIVIEKAGETYSAYAPDLPGCIATGETVKEVELEMQQAIRFHIDGLREDGLAVPEAKSVVEYVEA
jgi:predicted RNase H-like HicB family nuclease